MAFMFGRGSKASKSTAPYMGPEIGTAQSPMHSGYVKGYGMGEARRSSGASRMPGEMTSARQYADVPISQRSTVSRGMTPGQTRSLLAKRGQLRGLEGRGVQPAAGTRSAGRPVKTNAGGRAVGPGYGSLVNHRQVAAQGQASAAARNNMGLSGRGVRPNAHNAGGYRGTTREAYKRAESARRASITGGAPARVTRRAGGGGPARLPGGGLKGMPAASAVSGMNAPIVPAMPTNPSLIGGLGQLQGGYAGVVGDSVRKVQAETRAARAPMRREMIQRAKNNPAYTGARRGMTGAGAGAGAGVIDDAVRDIPRAGAREAVERIGKKGFMRSGKGLAIGLGAAVIGGLAYSGRRGEGSSGGRTSMSRY